MPLIEQNAAHFAQERAALLHSLASLLHPEGGALMPSPDSLWYQPAQISKAAADDVARRKAENDAIVAAAKRHGDDLRAIGVGVHVDRRA